MPGKTRKAAKSSAQTRLNPIQQKQLIRSMMRHKNLVARARARQQFMRSLSAILHRKAANKSIAAVTRKQLKNATMKVEQDVRRSVRLAAAAALKKAPAPAKSVPAARTAKAMKSMLYPSVFNRTNTRKISNINAMWAKRIQTIAKEAKKKAMTAARAKNTKADPAFNLLVDKTSKIHIA